MEKGADWRPARGYWKQDPELRNGGGDGEEGRTAKLCL